MCVSKKVQGCFKSVSRIFRVVTRKFQKSFKRVFRMFRQSFKGVLRTFWGCLHLIEEGAWPVFQDYFKGVSRSFQICWKYVCFFQFQGLFTTVFRKFKECIFQWTFKSASKVLQRKFQKGIKQVLRCVKKVFKCFKKV